MEVYTFSKSGEALDRKVCQNFSSVQGVLLSERGISFLYDESESSVTVVYRPWDASSANINGLYL